jgi:hypothetical protein
VTGVPSNMADLLGTTPSRDLDYGIGQGEDAAGIVHLRHRGQQMWRLLLLMIWRPTSDLRGQLLVFVNMVDSFSADEAQANAAIVKGGTAQQGGGSARA